MSSLLKDHQANMMTGLAAEIEQLNQTIARQRAELERVYKQLALYREWQRHVQQVAATPVPDVEAPPEGAPTISMPVLSSPEEFAPASSQPSGPQRRINPLTANGSGKNPLSDSFVL